MTVALVYDSVFGNTAEIARAIARGLEAGGRRVTLLPMAEIGAFDPKAHELLVAGSPTRGFAPTPALLEFIGGLPDGTGPVAAFDTRLDLETINPAPLRWVVNAGGYAASRIGEALKRKGYVLIGPLGDFKVSGTEGPLLAGELDRAEAWGEALAARPT
jgi:flavodoxin